MFFWSSGDLSSSAKARQKVDELDGLWLKDGAVRAGISGLCVTFLPEQLDGYLTQLRPQEYSLPQADGTSITAVLGPKGKLQWSNGSVWQRKEPEAAEGDLNGTVTSARSIGSARSRSARGISTAQLQTVPEIIEVQTVEMAQEAEKAEEERREEELQVAAGPLVSMPIEAFQAAASTNGSAAGPIIHSQSDLYSQARLRCTFRKPVLGDMVESFDGVLQCVTDANGNERGWELQPGEIATVMQVDADGDFRLCNPSGLESAYTFRKYYAYVPVQACDDRDDEVMDDEEMERLRRISSMRGRRNCVIAEMNTNLGELYGGENWHSPVHLKTKTHMSVLKRGMYRSPLFHAILDDERLTTMVINAFEGPHRYSEGQEVFRQNDGVHLKDRAFFVVESGSLTGYKRGSRDAHPGQKSSSYNNTISSSFGSLALMYDNPRTETVIATSESVVWSIDRESYKSCVVGRNHAIRRHNAKLLRSVDLFEKLSEEEMSRLLDIMKLREYQKGDPIFSQGDMADAIYIIEQGIVCTLAEDVSFIQPGQYFGQDSLYGKAPRMFSAMANASPTVVGVLDSTGVYSILGREVVAEIMEGQEEPIRDLAESDIIWSWLTCCVSDRKHPAVVESLSPAPTPRSPRPPLLSPKDGEPISARNLRRMSTGTKTGYREPVSGRRGVRSS